MFEHLYADRKVQPYLITGRKNESYLLSLALLPVSYFLLPLNLLRLIGGSLYDMALMALGVIYIHALQIPYQCLLGNVDTLPRSVAFVEKREGSVVSSNNDR